MRTSTARALPVDPPQSDPERGTLFALQRTVWLLSPGLEPLPLTALAAAERSGDLATRAACITLRGTEIVIEAPGAEALDVVGRSLKAARTTAALPARLEGPHCVGAVSPPLCYGKLRFSNLDLLLLKRGIEAACDAAITTFVAAGYRRLG